MQLKVLYGKGAYIKLYVIAFQHINHTQAKLSIQGALNQLLGLKLLMSIIWTNIFIE